MWKRLAPSRTKKLSTSWVMILRLTGRGKVARCGLCFFLFIQIKIDYAKGFELNVCLFHLSHEKRCRGVRVGFGMAFLCHKS